MENQNSTELEKDEDFDFFKKSKNSKSKDVNKDKDLIKDENHLGINFLINSKKYVKKNRYIVMFAIFAVSVPVAVGLFSLEHTNKQLPNHFPNPIVAPISQSTPIVVEAKPGEKLEEPFKVDYSKVSKEDAQRIKQALQGFQDIQKQLKEIGNPSQPEK